MGKEEDPLPSVFIVQYNNLNEHENVSLSDYPRELHRGAFRGSLDDHKCVKQTCHGMCFESFIFPYLFMLSCMCGRYVTQFFIFSCNAILSQKLPKTVAESVGMQNNGNVGIHLEETRRVTTVPYATAIDGHVVLGGSSIKIKILRLVKLFSSP